MTGRSNGAWEPRGPWVLPIGTAVIGGVAVLVTAVGVARRRRRQGEESASDA